MIARIQTLTVVYFTYLFYLLDFCHSSMTFEYTLIIGFIAKVTIFIVENLEMQKANKMKTIINFYHYLHFAGNLLGDTWANNFTLSPRFSNPKCNSINIL